ncbi:MAG TPA: FKBP-type peptidyl-prolyl cis-trans isomerase [Thermoanaerobaculia bacterium]|nr:FKBP-type peptidyl-prolyl cis-trans isomerase [Thermoanaerobaculia bacterium]
MKALRTVLATVLLTPLAFPAHAAPPATAAKPTAPTTIPAPPDVAAPPADAQVTASGLASKVLQAGTGALHPALTDAVKVHYSGWTTDGKMFDSSVVRGRPLVFPLNRVIAGWGEGLQLMVAGEKRRLWIPAKLAYEGVADRPQGMLVFDVELLDVLRVPPTPPDVAAPPADAGKSASGLAWKVLEKGKGERHPAASSIVRVHYTGWTTDGKMFESSLAKGTPASFKLTDVIPGWTEGLQLMVEGESRRFWIPKGLAYRGLPDKPEGMLVFDVTLLEITKP